MPSNQFQHLSLIQVARGAAKLTGGGKASQTTKENKANRAQHSSSLVGSASSISNSRKSSLQERDQRNLPAIPSDVPILLKMDPSIGLDFLEDLVDFEVISEHEDGFVIIASEDIDLTSLIEKSQDFEQNIHGTANIACIHKLFEDPAARKEKILSETLLSQWDCISNTDTLMVDVGVTCLGKIKVPKEIKRKKRESDEQFRQRKATWQEEKNAAYESWDNLKIQREREFENFVNGYQGVIHRIVDGNTISHLELPDCFSVRVELTGQAFKDLVINYPHVFEVVEPDDVQLFRKGVDSSVIGFKAPTFSAPDIYAPAVCVIDSGIQERHPWLVDAIDYSASHCYLPSKQPNEIEDEVNEGGHGTRVAGAILFPTSIPTVGDHKHSTWIQNARVLTDRCLMPNSLFPPILLQIIVKRFLETGFETRLYNHSIASSRPSRIKHMSAWAAAIDQLSYEKDVLFLQASGNIPDDLPDPFWPGVKQHLESGKEFPTYLFEKSCRIRNPAQSLQAITVGSIAHTEFNEQSWKSISKLGWPSAFSCTGPGIWGSIKPDVVEFGGDIATNYGDPLLVGTPDIAAEICPELIRTTFQPGPSFSRDSVGTSFSTPKVASIAAALHQILPDESTLLYRALIAHSARWPEWTAGEGFHQKRQILDLIGYGLVDLNRAIGNTDYRITMITTGENRISPGQAHIYQIPIPQEIRTAAIDGDVLVEVTLSYAASPRRTRRKIRGYLSTWVDWKSSKIGETIESFASRSLKESPEQEDNSDHAFPWVIHEKDTWGEIKGIRRNAGTLQKDWALVKSNVLPENFCISVVGHKGWDKDPDASAKYSLAISFESTDKKVFVYEPMRVSLDNLRSEIQIKMSL